MEKTNATVDVSATVLVGVINVNNSLMLLDTLENAQRLIDDPKNRTMPDHNGQSYQRMYVVVDDVIKAKVEKICNYCLAGKPLVRKDGLKVYTYHGYQVWEKVDKKSTGVIYYLHGDKVNDPSPINNIPK
jgi:hypothetical protein